MLSYISLQVAHIEKKIDTPFIVAHYKNNGDITGMLAFLY